jgi:hypothetical protein
MAVEQGNYFMAALGIADLQLRGAIDMQGLLAHF